MRTYNQSVYFAARLNVPELGRVVHTSGGQYGALWIERQAHYLGIGALERVKALAALRAPQLTRFVK